MEKDNKKNINRRNFLKVVGTGTVATTAALYGCNSNRQSSTNGTTTTEVPTDKMTYRTNPSTGDKVSLLGYGCMRWPTRKKTDGEGIEIDQETVNRLVDYAIAHGVNYFDTAPPYVQGLSERATGIALKRHPRNKMFIATKLSNFDPQSMTRENSIALYHKSLQNLQVDYIDYYLLHAVGIPNMDVFKKRYIDNHMIDYLVKEREAGRIRNLGWSFHGDINVFNYLLSLDVKWDFVQIQLNYSDWKHASDKDSNAEYLYNELSKRKIPAIVMEPLLGGRLSKLNDKLVAELKQHRPQDSIASWAFRYAGSLPDVLTVLSGMTYIDHLKDNIRTYSPLQPLTKAENELLEHVAQEMLKRPVIPCTGCKYCMPCPYGLDIPAIFAHYNRCINKNDIPESRKSKNYEEARRAFLIGYDRSVPKLRQASHCIKCNQCSPHCPQSIYIPREMEKIDNYVEQLKQGTL
ncbi:MAG: aldo/keto reductase [Bacteroidaceae bacterium]|nr:aldo/keto reductase [Bacteroidaceae bacterium]